jgi:glucans biosynthesis protein C
MTTLTNQKTDRQYYIDWLRIILILSVFLFHIGMIFNTWPWHVKNGQQLGGGLKLAMTFLHNWRMPLLFMLAGAGTWFALGKRTPGQYLAERFKRLIIPLAAGIFILVPVQVYIEKIGQYSSLPEFYTHMFEGIYPQGNFSWHHLWFIVYLFVIALMVSPFLNFLRSRRFEKFTCRLEKIVTKPLSLNIVIIPLLLSQILLRPFFELETHSLVDDWATMSLYIIFFMAGYILLPVSSIAESMRVHRLWYLAETAVAAFLMFRVSGMIADERSSELIWDISSVFMAWSCSVTAIGFAKQYLNSNSPFRKLANEAIYPFYLLHQPVIVIAGYFTVQLEAAIIWKALIVLVSSFTTITVIYWFLIRPFNLTRVIFGMKRIRKDEKEKKIEITQEPAISESRRA